MPLSAESERGPSQILGQTMTFLKFFELTLFRVIASEFCNSGEPPEEGKVWEHEQQWLFEYFQNTRRQILLIKRNRKLCGSLLPWEFKCVWGGCCAVCRAGLRLATGQDHFNFPTAMCGLSSGPALCPAVRKGQRDRRDLPHPGLHPTRFSVALPESPAF